MTLFKHPITVLTKTGQYVDGVWEWDADTSRTVYGSVQAMSYHDILMLDIGRRDVGQVKVYCDEALKVSQAGTENTGDIIQWDDRNWEIIKAMDFQNGVIDHYKYIAELRIAEVVPEVPN